MPARSSTSASPVKPDRQLRQQLGRFDHVTLLPNRLQFAADFKRLRGRTGKGKLLVLVTLAEARHYNEILRALGHAFADQFVREGLKRIQSLMPRDLAIYHVSVLSFAFVIDHAEDTLPAIASEIAQAFVGAFDVDRIPIRSDVGVGLLPLAGKHVEAAECLRATLVAAQDSRRTDSRIAFYNHRSDAAHLRAFRILADLPGALTQPDQLALHYQPRVHLADGSVRSAEALIRWRHPELGSISPGEFVPLVEQTALIHQLTDWVVGRAVADLRQVSERGFATAVSVNVSPRNLMETGFDDRLLWACDSEGISPENIEVEYTETMLAAGTERLTRQLERLRGAGIRVAIDDFGSGFSNLAYITQIPADILKIDQSFIRPLQPEHDFLVRQILQLAHGTGLKVCAEGVETPLVLNHLAAIGCDEAQGYAIARPMPLADYLGWLGGL